MQAPQHQAAPEQYQAAPVQATQYQSSSTLQYDVVTMGAACGSKNTFDAKKIKTTLNEHAQQGKELVHIYQDVQQQGCNRGVMVIMIFKYR